MFCHQLTSYYITLLSVASGLLCTCRAKDSQAASASARRLVQVQQHYSVTISLPLSLPVSDGDDADTKATALTQGTSALEAALTAGLRSGGQSPPAPSLPPPSFLGRM